MLKGGTLVKNQRGEKKKKSDDGWCFMLWVQKKRENRIIIFHTKRFDMVNLGGKWIHNNKKNS